MLKHLRLLDVLIKYSTAAILLAIPLYPKFPLMRIPGTFVAIRLEDLLLAFSTALLISLILTTRSFFKDKITRSIILYLSVGFISLSSSIFITKTILPHIGFLHWVRRIEYFIPLYLGYESIKKNRANLEFYLKILLIVVFLAFIWGFGQKHMGWPIIITQNEEYSKGMALKWISGSHINSTFAGHYDLGTYLVLVLPIVITSLAVLKGVKTKLILLGTLFSGLWLLVNTASRISLTSYLFSATFSLILIKRYKLIPLILIVSLAFVGFSSNLLARYGRLFEVSREKFQEFNRINYSNTDYVLAAVEDPFVTKVPPTPTPLASLEDRSTNIRLNVEWPRAIRAFLKNPLLGTGYSSITLATDNDYLRLLGEVGLLGFISFFLIFIGVTERLVSLFPFTKNFKNYELSFIAGFVGSLPGIFANAVFIDVFEASKFAIIFWLLMGFVLAITQK